MVIHVGMIGQRNLQKRYQAFVEAGVDDETAKFYQKKRQMPILGRESFIKQKTRKVVRNREQPESQRPMKEITLAMIVETVAQIFRTDPEEIYRTSKGRGQVNEARSAALYVARKTASMPLTEIAEHFGLGHYGSVSGSNARFEKRMAEDEQLGRLVARVSKAVCKL